MSASLHYSPAETTVMLLAAGHGTRMRPLTDNTPKPLLNIGGKSLIEHHLENLRQAGFLNIVINIAYLGDQIKERLGDGRRFSLDIQYSDEQDSGALETAGGIKKALPLINSDPFLVINADIWTDFDFETILHPLEHQARLVMVNNPPHHPEGDFSIDPSSLLTERDIQAESYTFSGIALYRKSVFENIEHGKQALRPVFNNGIQQQCIEAQIHSGQWYDVGTPESLQQVDQLLLNKL